MHILYQSILVRIGCKHLFKISCTDVAISRHTHTLQANGDYDKKAWLNAFKSVVPVLCSASSKSTQVWQNLLNSSIVLLTFVTIFIHDCCDAECCSVTRGLMGGKAQGFMHGMIFYSFWKKVDMQWALFINNCCHCSTIIRLLYSCYQVSGSIKWRPESLTVTCKYKRGTAFSTIKWMPSIPVPSSLNYMQADGQCYILFILHMGALMPYSTSKLTVCRHDTKLWM